LNYFPQIYVRAQKKRAGFSLILVLLISLCGAALLGGVMYMIEGFAGATRTTIRKEEIYIRMQDEVEKAKATLKLAMDTATTPLQMTPIPIGTKINSLDDLIVQSGGSPFGIVNDNITVGGLSGTLSVRIYDMQYPASQVNDSDEDLVASLPPCMESLVLTGSGVVSGPLDGGTSEIGGALPELSGGGSAGAYLIRATVELSNGSRDTIETAIIQSIGTP
jgi:hypothetical protein